MALRAASASVPVRRKPSAAHPETSSTATRRFEPRFGFASRATPTLVIRAGYGITYDPFSLQRPLRTNYPILLIQNITAPNSFSAIGKLSDGLPIIKVPDLGNGILDIPGT